MTTRTVAVVAGEIFHAWGRCQINYAAKPYLAAMLSIHSTSPTAMYGADEAQSVVAYFLGNATSFRGEKARALKAELKKMMNIK